MGKDQIKDYLKARIEYDDCVSYIPNHHSISSSLADQMGFTSYVANIITNSFLQYLPTGDKEKDSDVLSEKIYNDIWK